MVTSPPRLALLFFAAALATSSCDRPPQAADRQSSTARPQATASPAPGTAPGEPPRNGDPAPEPKEPEPLSVEEGTATWYEVPDGSLADRRSASDLTAAFNKLPSGSVVRVTDLKTDRKVTVTITDAGVPSSKTIDLSKEAAEEIGLVRKGKAKVRIEVLSKPET
jgi:rare lipoprotein A